MTHTGPQNVGNAAAAPSTPAHSQTRLQRRFERLKQTSGFAFARGNSLKDRLRLFYHAGMKPSLAYRRLARYTPQNIERFSIKVAPQRLFDVHLRDNGLDIETLAEFFCDRPIMFPAELPAFRPKVIYDIGANIGIASLFFATKYPEARIFGFEPLPANRVICEMNLKNLIKAKCLPWAVGASDGHANFEFNSNDLRGGRLGTHGAAPAAERIEVTVRSIASLIKEGLEPPDFVKIDVEGAEMDVLAGIGERVREIRMIYVETHSPELQARCTEWLGRNRFSIRHTYEAGPGFAAIWSDRL